MNTEVLLGMIVLGALGGVAVYNFLKLSKEKKIANIKQWLKIAVVEAEKLLGSKTGQLKLRYVYDLAIKQYPWLITFITFEMFKDWVDEALAWMETQIDNNPAIKAYIGRE